MRTRGKQLMMDEHYAVDSIRPKCVELQRMCEQYKELLRKRRQMLTKSHDLQDRLDRANKWCSSGVDMLANQPVDRLQTAQGAQKALQDIEAYLNTAKELKLSNPKEFRQLFESMMTAETRANVQHILKRMEDVQGMCAKRKESLRPITGPSKTQPVQQVTGELGTQGDSSQNQLGGPDGKKPVVYAEKSARFRPEIQHHTSSSSNGVSNASDLSFNLSNVSSSSHSASDTSSSFASETQRSSVSSVSMSSFPEGDSLKSKQRHIMNELIETEEAYVNELHQILQGYFNKMDDRSLLMMIPPALQGQKHILFGNLDDIYRFHKDLFLNELRECRESPARVGKIFVNRKEEFQMYSIYCQNKPKSEALRIRVGDSNPFFKECQRQLGHRLPLGAYLLKPIQRITKYQLLLKEMLKNTGDNPDLTAALNEALDTMLSVLAYLNDSMHQVAISGYSGNLSDLGRLLLHGSFRVWTEHKREKLRDLRLRPMQRHVFLYQHDMLLCKQRDGDESQPTYTFKTKINLSQVGLTEKIKGDKRKFELWLRGREEVYIIQAPDMATKDVWIKEIKRVLLSQFDHLKANRQLLTSTAQGSQISSGSDYSLDNWRSSGDEGDIGRGNNNNSKSSSLTRNIPNISAPFYEGEEERRDQETGGAGDEEYYEDDGGGWSSGEFSNTDDEQLADQHIPKIEPSYCERFVSLGDYYPIDSTELGLTEGDEVEVQRVGTNGWWFARHLATGGQGWVPSTYLESISRQGHGHGVSSSNSEGNLFSSSDSLCVAGARGEMTRSASGRHYYRSNSPVPETTV
ncbi:guanine nucleotide exchange factor dbs [Plakobranchus ocellatus]|uniref:Guanine nucleotide exchange factor dbs n=1 Tax=Plakobranchus ocellatus TaxID=259542 RepID=A0AAV3ZUM9_9GAST|nr:guanine nucleotide exchange factor dbs [Plakobranchus ocellatus]